MILLAALAGWTQPKEIAGYWQRLNLEFPIYVFNYPFPAKVPSVARIARVKQELETHDIAELECECFDEGEDLLTLLTLPDPNLEALASSPLLDAQLTTTL